MFELAEHTQIYKTIQQREETPLSEYVSMQDLAKKFNIDIEKI